MNNQTHKLMIKTHNKTGLKYLCYTKTSGEEYDKYPGSGTHWKRHIKKHGNDITTKLIFETLDKVEFKKVAKQKSVEYDVVNSNEWANLKEEEGDGGDTVSNKRWITNGEIDKYILINEEIPAGWKLGRTRCVFNDSKKQTEFGSRVDLKKRGDAIKVAWDSGKYNHRDNSKLGQRNKEQVVKDKISAALMGKEFSNKHKANLKTAASKRGQITCPHCSKTGSANIMKRWHFNNCKTKI